MSPGWIPQDTSLASPGRGHAPAACILSIAPGVGKFDKRLHAACSSTTISKPRAGAQSARYGDRGCPAYIRRRGKSHTAGKAGAGGAPILRNREFPGPIAYIEHDGRRTFGRVIPTFTAPSRPIACRAQRCSCGPGFSCTRVPDRSSGSTCSRIRRNVVVLRRIEVVTFQFAVERARADAQCLRNGTPVMIMAPQQIGNDTGFGTCQ